MAYTAVVTAGGTLGPAKTNTSLSYPNVSSINIDITRGILRINYVGQLGPAYVDLDYTQTVTLTDSISGTVSTITIA